MEEYGYYQILEYEKNQAKKDDSKRENTDRKPADVASSNKVSGGDKKEIATIDSGGKDIKLQESGGVNEVELREAQKKPEDNNEDNMGGSSWFGITAAVGMVAISVVIIVIKVYRQKTRLS